MPKINAKRSKTSKLVHVFIQDTSKTDGSGLTGLVYNSTGLTAYYLREGDASTTAITLATTTLGTWVSGGFVEVDSVHMPGWYELGVPNAALASGESVKMHLRGATNMAPVPMEIQLDSVDNQDAVAYGLSRLDAAVSTRARPADILLTPGNLLKTDASGEVDVDLGQAVPNSPVQGSVGDALLAAEAQGEGKWTLVGTTLNIYRHDGTTLVKSFTLDSAIAPTQRV